MSEKLKPCPFCKIPIENERCAVGSHNGLFFVMCGNCKAQGPKGTLREDAVAEWNKRATEEKPQ